MSNWPEKIAEWQTKYGCTIWSPLRKDRIEFVAKLLNMPEPLKEMYSYMNSLSLSWFLIIQMEDDKNIRRTWDGIIRANDTEKSSFLERDMELLERFLVFADIGEGCCAVIDRNDFSIWFEENDELVITNLDLFGFIEACLRDASGE